VNRYNWYSLFILVFLISLFGLLAQSNEVLALTVQTGSFKIDLQGEKTWTVNFGLGDAESLSKVGYPKDSYSLEQTLKVDLTGQLGEYFSLGADLDDTKPGYLQEFGLKMDTDNWDGQLGDFGTGEDNFTVYNKKILGVELTGELADSELGLLAGRLQGISETKIFYGNTGESEVEYSLYLDEAQLEETGYKKNIRGLQYFDLTIDYVKGFTDPELEIESGDPLWSFLDQWEFGDLGGEIEDEPTKELTSGQFDVISEEIDYMILLTDWKSLVRNRLKTYIARYNQDLPEEEKKEYPFNPGTDYEDEFFHELVDYVKLSVGESDIQLTQYKNNRFYYLGRTGIKEEGFQLEVRPDGDWVDAGELTGYDYSLFPEKGLMDLQFPGEFFQNLEDKGIRVQFQYEISGKMYSLGFSVAPNSEKVYLNGKLLERNTDYSIDYETGSLLIFREIGEDDKIKVDFERARGGLGGFAQFSRNIYGFSTRMSSDYGLVMDVSLFQARDSAPEELSPEIPTMPNVHTVGGVRARYEENGWKALIEFAGNVNRFPSDDNQRTNLPNSVEKIVSLGPAGYDMTLFAHKNGFTIKDREGWNSFGPQDGLAGNNINDGLVVENFVFLGTNAGVTAVELSGSAPFARTANWESYYESDGLPGSEVVGLTDNGEKIWAATETGIAETAISDLTGEISWETVTKDFETEFSLNAIVHVSDHLWLGTNRGLYLYEISSGELVGDGPRVEGRVIDMEAKGDELFLVTEEGILRIGLESEEEFLLESRTVMSISVGDEKIWFGTERGFASIDSPTNYGDKTVTAILVDGEKIWAGSKGYGTGNARELVIYELGDDLTEYFTDETKIKGKDDDRFRSIDPASHTDKGISLRADIGKRVEIASSEVLFSTSFEYVQPSYTPIGRLQRQDRVAAGLSMDAELTKTFSLGLSSDYSVSSLSTEDSSWAFSNQLSADWQALVDIYAAVTWDTRVEGKEVLGLDIGVAKSLWAESLTAGIDLSAVRETDSSGEVSSYASISANLGIAPGDSTSLSMNYSYPFSFGSLERRAEEELGWEVNYSRMFPLGSDYGVEFNLTGNGSAEDLLGGGYRSFKNQSELKLDFDSLDLGQLGLTPYLSVSWKGTNASNEFKGEVSGQGDVLDLSGRTTLSRSVSLSANSKLVEYEDKLRGRFSYRTALLAPKIDYSLSRVLLTHPDFGERSKYRATLTLGAKWKPRGNLSNEFRGGVRYKSEQGLTYTLKDIVNWKLTDKLTPEFSLNAEYLPGTEEWDLQVESDVSYPIRNRWGISVVSGFNWGVEETGEVYNGFFGSAGLRVEF